MIIPIPPDRRTPDEVLEVPVRTCNLRGAVFGAHLAWVRKRHGRAGIGAVWNLLPGGMRGRDPDSIQPIEWLPFGWLIAMDRAIVQLFGEGREEVIFELGRSSAEQNFGGGAALDLGKGVNIQHHFWDAKAHHSRFQDYGVCEYVPLNQNSFRMNYRDYVVRSRVFCLSACGYFEASIDFLGGKEPIVEEVACQCLGDPSCSYIVSWEP